MREGVLVICFETGRMDIRFSIDEYYGGPHCGTQLEALVDGNGIPTRIEMAEDWYLVGINTKNIAGPVRIET